MNNIYDFFRDKPDNKLLIVSDDKEALSAYNVLKYLNYEPFILSDLRANFGDDLLSFSEEIGEITKSLENFYNYKKQNKILISPVRTISFPLPKEECFDSFTISFADTLNFEELKSKLYNWGYYFVDIVTSEGEVSFRGDIIDIAPLNSEVAFRVSLFDDEVESIREFDIEDQKSSKEEIESFSVAPAFLALDETKFELINEKIQRDTNDAFIKDIHSLGFWHLDEMAEFYSSKYKSVITKDALTEIDEAYIFDESRIQKEELLVIPFIPTSTKYSQIAPANIKEYLTFHKIFPQSS